MKSSYKKGFMFQISMQKIYKRICARTTLCIRMLMNLNEITLPLHSLAYLGIVVRSNSCWNWSFMNNNNNVFSNQNAFVFIILNWTSKAEVNTLCNRPKDSWCQVFIISWYWREVRKQGSPSASHLLFMTL